MCLCFRVEYFEFENVSTCLLISSLIILSACSKLRQNYCTYVVRWIQRKKWLEYFFEMQFIEKKIIMILEIAEKMNKRMKGKSLNE